MTSAISFPSGENLLNVNQAYDEEWGFPMCGGQQLTEPHIFPYSPRIRVMMIISTGRGTTVLSYAGCAGSQSLGTEML